MDRRRNARISAVLPVRVWGVDASSSPFMQLATVTNISAGGATVHGVSRRLKPGHTVELQYGDEVGQFRVVWVGQAGTPQAGEVGVQSVMPEAFLWGVNLERCSQLIGMG